MFSMLDGVTQVDIFMDKLVTQAYTRPKEPFVSRMILVELDHPEHGSRAVYRASSIEDAFDYLRHKELMPAFWHYWHIDIYMTIADDIQWIDAFMRISNEVT